MARDHGERIGRTIGCRRCGRRRGLIRRHGSKAMPTMFQRSRTRDRFQEDELRRNKDAN